VTDDGIGLAPEMRPDLFEIFHQAKDTLDRSQGGLGIGLALSKGLVELHGGRIEAESEGPGRGSTFRVVIPFDATLPDAPAGSDRTVMRRAGRSVRRLDQFDFGRNVAAFCVFVAPFGEYTRTLTPRTSCVLCVVVAYRT